MVTLITLPAEIRFNIINLFISSITEQLACEIQWPTNACEINWDISAAMVKARILLLPLAFTNQTLLHEVCDQVRHLAQYRFEEARRVRVDNAEHKCGKLHDNPLCSKCKDYHMLSSQARMLENVGDLIRDHIRARGYEGVTRRYRCRCKGTTAGAFMVSDTVKSFNNLSMRVWHGLGCYFVKPTTFRDVVQEVRNSYRLDTTPTQTSETNEQHST